MDIAFVLYPGMTALDLVGPYEVMARWPGAVAHFVATSADPVATDAGLVIVPTETTAELPDPDVIVVPGSSTPFSPLADAALVEWLRTAAPGATWVTSVCTGSSLLAAAGLLSGRKATTHWGFREALAGMGVQVVTERVVVDGNVVTGAGVSAGIDMALALTAQAFGPEMADALQLGIEYAPDPASGTAPGSPETAKPEIVELVRSMMAPSMTPPA
jgi:transcriptional regulator GlxA family with amidase domain